MPGRQLDEQIAMNYDNAPPSRSSRRSGARERGSCALDVAQIEQADLNPSDGASGLDGAN